MKMKHIMGLFLATALTACGGGRTDYTNEFKNSTNNKKINNNEFVHNVSEDHKTACVSETEKHNKEFIYEVYKRLNDSDKVLSSDDEAELKKINISMKDSGIINSWEINRVSHFRNSDMIVVISTEMTCKKHNLKTAASSQYVIDEGPSPFKVIR